MMKTNELTTQVKIRGCSTVMNATGAPRTTACSMETKDMKTNFDSEYSSDILLALYACMFATTSVQQFKTPKRTIGMSLTPLKYFGSQIPKLLVMLISCLTNTNGFTRVQISSRTTLTEVKATNGFITSFTVTVILANFVAAPNSLFIRIVLASSDEKETLKPHPMNHGVAIHAILQPLMEKFSSSIFKGYMPAAIRNEPRQIRPRNMGCDALTMRLLLFFKTQMPMTRLSTTAMEAIVQP
mmetsp:Transcript_5646/g.13095  ORF Transcript_5646/g.13095 Transcript_5646/m.13095 type:complete len:241 (+) Transcript_5646:237-959(+)